MKTIVLSIIVTAALLFGGTSLTADAGVSNFTQMMYRELINTQKNPREVTRTFEPIGKGSGLTGYNDVRLTEVGSDYYCGMHSDGGKECWRDDQVVSVEFLNVH